MELQTSTKMHFLYLEEYRNGKWEYLGRVSCFCSINENHWKERNVA